MTDNHDVSHDFENKATPVFVVPKKQGQEMAIDTSIAPLPDVIKGKSDWREYRSFKLSNGVSCTVVHDKESKTTAAAACVDVGAGSDPHSLSGLAHFCEHMCFLGSEKYPGENEYKHYLSMHGGRSNASTSPFVTIYKFDVIAEFAEKSLDIFSHFFVEPLFTVSGTSREVQAVASENSKNLVADGRRRLQILKALADPNHYFSKFTTGNASTLPTDNEEKIAWIREALLAFHRKHYRPENLSVVIVGPQSLDQLQDWVVPRFAPMKARSFPANPDQMTPMEKLIQEASMDAPNYVYDKPAAQYRPAFYPKLQGKWPVLLTTKPVRSMKKLYLLFPLPADHRRTPDNSPVRILSHLLGHEGPGSSFAELQNKGLITALCAGNRVGAPDFSLFQIDVNLTELGEKRWMEVADALFAHCRLIKDAAAKVKSGDSSELKTLWGEVAALQSMFFHQNSPGNAYDFAAGLVGSIVCNGTDKCLSAGSMLNENSETLPIDQLLDYASRLAPANCIVERCSLQAWEEMEEAEKSTQEDKENLQVNMNKTTKPTAPDVKRHTEKWYGVEYFLSKIDENVIKKWDGTAITDHGNLQLPTPNRYIPRSLELCHDLPPEAKMGPRIEKEIDPPNLVVEHEIARLWHRLDDRYALPKSSLTFLLRNPAVENVKDKNGFWVYDVDSSIHSSIVSSMFSQAMAQETYDAQLAGLHWSLSITSSGIKISCSGFSDRLSDLAIKILKEFFTTDSFLQESFFISKKEDSIRNLRTFLESRRADAYASYYADLVLSSSEHGTEHALIRAEQATLDSAKKHHSRLLWTDDTSIDCLYSGNVSEEQAKEFFLEATNIMDEVRSKAAMTHSNGSSSSKIPWIPGPLTRSLLPGKDIELHFATKNTQEENGAVMVTYQSSVPGFKGESLSSNESLRSSAAIRLICHMLREPLFDELRTKQQLGYVVNAYYDIGFSTRQVEETVDSDDWPRTIPVDLIIINVLSSKLAPLEVADRIDEFVDSFRNTLLNMPESEIRSHAKSLSTKLLKPIQQLGMEASNQFAKIRRYGPEVLSKKSGAGGNLPWKSANTLAGAIHSLERGDLVDVWDRMVQPESRSRLMSCVYGSTYPLTSSKLPDMIKKRSAVGTTKLTVVDNLPGLFQLRNQLGSFDAGAITSLASNNQKRFLSSSSSPTVPRFFTDLRWSSTNNRFLIRAALIGVLGAAGVAVGLRISSNRSSAKKAT